MILYDSSPLHASRIEESKREWQWKNGCWSITRPLLYFSLSSLFPWQDFHHYYSYCTDSKGRGVVIGSNSRRSNSSASSIQFLSFLSGVCHDYYYFFAASPATSHCLLCLKSLWRSLLLFYDEQDPVCVIKTFIGESTSDLCLLAFSKPIVEKWRPYAFN